MDANNTSSQVIASCNSTGSGWKVFGRMLEGIYPATRLNVFGSQSLVEGALLGEGRDAKVYYVRGNQDWVIKVYKSANPNFVSDLAYHINQLAEDESLKIPKVIDLRDGRILQPFIDGTPKANQLWGGAEAQLIANEVTKKAKLKLGVGGNREFIDLPQHHVKMGIDPSYENFRFSNSGKLIGWIDPIFTLLKHAPKLSVAAQISTPIAVMADYKEALEHLQDKEFNYLSAEQKRDYAHIYASAKLQQSVTLNIDPTFGYADFKAWAMKANIAESHWIKLDPTPVSEANVRFGLPVQGFPNVTEVANLNI